MKRYRVWADDRSQSCLLLAADDHEACVTIAGMKIFNDLPLTPQEDLDGGELEMGYVILPDGKKVPIPGEANAHRT
jgi:hypothetical protein